MITEIHIGTLYTHRLHGSMFIVGSVTERNVLAYNTYQAKEYKIPIDTFVRWFLPHRRET